jgi:hypothetical protein
MGRAKLKLVEKKGLAQNKESHAMNNFRVYQGALYASRTRHAT